MKIKIKTVHAQEKEYIKVINLITEVLHTPFGAAPYVIMPGNEDNMAVAAYSGKEVVGCLVFLIENGEMYCKQFAVKQSMRNHLVGIKLIHYAGGLAEKSNVKRIYMTARLSAVKLYERYGFKRISEPFLNNVRGVFIPSVKMEKNMI